MIAELGSGSGAKTRTILERVRQRQNAVYYPIDVSASRAGPVRAGTDVRWATWFRSR